MEDELKELWDEYRIGKCFYCFSDILQHVTLMAPQKRLKKQYDVGEQRVGREPKPGSLFWVMTIDPPPWFAAAMTDDQIVLALETARGPKKVRKRKGKRKT